MTAPEMGFPTPVLITPHDLAGRLADVQAGRVVLLDVRTELEWRIDGHISGATWLPMDQVEARVQQEVPPEAEVIVYCAHGVRSDVVARYMAWLGYDHVGDLQGGLANWLAAGLPVDRGLPPA